MNGLNRDRYGTASGSDRPSRLTSNTQRGRSLPLAVL